MLSLVYDVLWLLLRGSEYAADEETGGMETSLKQFSLVLVIASLIIKVPMVFAFWMASLKFADVIDERSSLL